MGAEWMLAYGVLGAFVGFMAGLFGVGGGGLLVPLLAMLLRYQGMEAEHVVHYALGTAFACMMVSSVASMRAHARRANVEWHVFYCMGAGILFGTFVTTRMVASIHSGGMALFVAGIMGLMAVQMFMNWKPRPSGRPMTKGGLLLAGVGIGTVSALAAVGGGVLTIMYLTFKHVPMKRAVGTSAAIGFPIALAGTIGYFISGAQQTISEPYTIGFIYLPAFLAIAASSMLAAPTGARLAQCLPDAYLKKIFAILCLILSVKMLFTVA